ncbi:MAG: hypothetical protein KAY96_02715, partial [Bacteroidia bacterium]|nr:hypothetical protein [Bacteroidia bacterium]
MECNNILFRLAGSSELGMSFCTKAQMRLGLSAFVAVLLLFLNGSLFAGSVTYVKPIANANLTAGHVVTLSDPTWVDEFN